MSSVLEKYGARKPLKEASFDDVFKMNPPTTRADKELQLAGRMAQQGTLLQRYLPKYEDEYGAIFPMLESDPNNIISMVMLKQRVELRGALIIDANRDKRKLKAFLGECESNVSDCKLIIRAVKARKVNTLREYDAVPDV